MIYARDLIFIYFAIINIQSKNFLIIWKKIINIKEDRKLLNLNASKTEGMYNLAHSLTFKINCSKDNVDPPESHYNLYLN